MRFLLLVMKRIIIKGDNKVKIELESKECVSLSFLAVILVCCLTFLTFSHIQNEKQNKREDSININVPEIKIPKQDVNINVPEIKIPEIKMPKQDVSVNVPEIKIPNITIPKIEIPKSEVIIMNNKDEGYLPPPTNLDK